MADHSPHATYPLQLTSTYSSVRQTLSKTWITDQDPQGKLKDKKGQKESPSKAFVRQMKENQSLTSDIVTV
jgi:hypothetical protein